MSDKRYTKVEEEVLEILDRLEHEAPAQARPNLRLVPPPRRRSRPGSGALRRLRSRMPRLSGVWIAVAVIVGLFALTMINIPNVVALMLIFAIIGFFIWSMLRGGNRSSSSGGFSPPGTKTWRGRDITFGPDAGESPADRLSRWMDDRRRGRRR